MTTPTPDEICERLRLHARRVSETMRIMAQAKSLRQAHNPPRDDLYMWPKPEETVEWQASTLIQQQQATIERLSAALERAIEAIQEERDCTVESATVGPAHDLSTLDHGAKPYVEEYDAMLAYLRTALGKDASDVRSPGSSEGE